MIANNACLSSFYFFNISLIYIHLQITTVLVKKDFQPQKHIHISKERYILTN